MSKPAKRATSVAQRAKQYVAKLPKPRLSAKISVPTPIGDLDFGYDDLQGFMFGKRQSVPTAVAPYASLPPGMSDISALSFCFDACQVWQGNATNGANLALFLTPIANQGLYLTGGILPIAPGDNGVIAAGGGTFGAAYVTDLFKHFARVRFRKIVMIYCPLTANTGQDTVLYFAPIRGGAASISTASLGSAQGSVIPLSTIQGMRGNKGGPHWRPCVLDLTPYIAGGSGPKQNEFTLDITGSATAAVADLVAEVALPCEVAFGGNSSVSAHNGSALGYIKVCCVVDLLDFVGGLSLGSVTLDARRDRRKRLIDEIAEKLRNDKAISSGSLVSSDVDRKEEPVIIPKVTEPDSPLSKGQQSRPPTPIQKPVLRATTKGWLNT